MDATKGTQTLLRRYDEWGQCPHLNAEQFFDQFAALAGDTTGAPAWAISPSANLWISMHCRLSWVPAPTILLCKGKGARRALAPPIMLKF